MKKGIVVVALALCLLCGCGEKQGAGNKQGGLESYGANISVKDIKEKYQYQDNSVMPLYNVAPDEKFDFSFPCDLSDVSGSEQIVTVHTDESCSKESEVIVYHTVEKTENGSKVTVNPVAGVLTTESEEEAYMETDQGVWGNAPMYYLAIHYDMEADSMKKLETPQIIPFTVKHEVTAPQAKGVVSSDGRFKLSWDAVEGAEEYRVYKLVGSEQNAGDSNKPIMGKENGYQNCSLLFETSTKETEYDDFAGEGNGLAIHEASISGKEYVIGQNYSVEGEFYVSAVVDGKESGFCGAITTAELKLPHQFTPESDIMLQRYQSVSDMPLEVDVVNIDGSVTKRKVCYTFFKKKTYLDTEVPAYEYQVEGTALTGYVSMEDITGEYPETVGDTAISGNVEPENEVRKVPTPDVPTIIDPENSESEKPLVEQQQENTGRHVDKGNDEKVSNPGGNVKLFADSAEEEWLALNLVNGETEISVEAFPTLQNAEKLADVMYKVYYQNPYVLGLTRFSYDYENMMLKVIYSYDKKEIEAKQKEMKEAGEKILAEVVTDEMSEIEKENAIYQYMENNTQYDTAALEDAKKNNFKKTEDNTYEDSFNGYGILVNKKGVCQSYAYAYKLLCEMSGVSCRVVTGNLSGNLPHAWNAVKLGETWVQTDSTNNGKSTGIPYFLYNADHETAKLTGFDMDKNFELDSQVEQFQGEDNQYEYYYKNQLVAGSMDEYEQILERVLAENTDVISIRCTIEDVKMEEFMRAVSKAYNMRGKEDRLASLKYNIQSSYIVLK